MPKTYIRLLKVNKSQMKLSKMAQLSLSQETTISGWAEWTTNADVKVTLFGAQQLSEEFEKTMVKSF